MLTVHTCLVQIEEGTYNNPTTEGKRVKNSLTRVAGKLPSVGSGSRIRPLRGHVDMTSKIYFLLFKYFFYNFRYTTINRSRPSPSTTTEETVEAIVEEVQDSPRYIESREETGTKVGTTSKPLQYVNIRRARPSSQFSTDTADDTASRYIKYIIFHGQFLLLLCSEF